MAGYDNTTEMPHTAALYTAGVIQSLAILLCLVGNTIVSLTMVYYPRLRTSALLFMISLIFCDTLYLFLVLVPFTGNYFSAKNVLGMKYCEASNYIRTMSDGVQMWNVGFVILNQYVLLSNHEFFVKYNTDKTTVMQIIFSWFLPMLVMISGMIGNIGKSMYYSKVVHCVFFSDSSLTLIAFHTIFSLVLPGAFAVSSSIIILYNIRKALMLIYAGEQPDPHNGFRVDTIHHTKTFSAICVRIILVSVINIITRETRIGTSANILLLLDLFVSVCNCTNPFMYLLSREFRATSFAILRCNKKAGDEEEMTESAEDLKGSEVTLGYRARAYSTAGVY